MFIIKFKRKKQRRFTAVLGDLEQKMVDDIYFALNSHSAPLPCTARIGPDFSDSDWLIRTPLISFWK